MVGKAKVTGTSVGSSSTSVGSSCTSAGSSSTLDDFSSEEFPSLSGGVSSSNPKVSSGISSNPTPRVADLGVDPVQPSWRSLFWSDSSSTLEYSETVLHDGKPIVKISHATRSKGLALSDDSLIGHFHGSPPPLHLIQAVANNLWGRRGSVDVIAWENESFIFEFQNLQSSCG